MYTVCMYVRVCVYTYTYICIYMDIYIYIICDAGLSSFTFSALRGHRSAFIPKANELVWAAWGLIKCSVNWKAVSERLGC